jgi:hypothetical protein
MQRSAMRATQIIAVVALMLPLQFTHADLEADVMACADITEDHARLACYDAAISTSGSARSSSPKQPSQPVTAEDKFGERRIRAQETPKSAAPEIKEITARITGISRRARGQLVLTLDNDQVWEEKEPSTYFPVKIGDTVSIKARSFGSFQLTAAGGRSTQVMRAR